MSDDKRASGGGQSRGGDDPDEFAYYGPFGPGAPGAMATSGEDIDDTQPIGLESGYTASMTSLFPAPPGVEPLRPRPPAPVHPPPKSGRKPMRATAIIALAALTALLVGAAAGFGGAQLAGSGLVGVPAAASPRPTTAPGGTSTPIAPPPGQVNTVEISRRVLPSTVTIRVGDRTNGGSTGSGFVLDRDGRIMTNNHVVAGGADGSSPIQVIFSDGRRVQAKILGRSPSYDLAVVKVAATGSLVPIAIGDSDATEVGEPAIAVGSPLGLGGTVTEGIVSAKDRPVVVGGSTDADSTSAYINGIQTDAPINPGNSGGPLVDAGARVIGVNSAILTLGQSSGQNGNIGLGFAIPINQAMVIGKMLIKDGKATYPVIGATVTSQTDDTGVRLANVERKGPAERSGLRSGDIITNVDGERVFQAEELIVAIRTHRPGDTITLRYTRNDRAGEVQVKLGSKEG